jgi:hypothetical protein
LCLQVYLIQKRQVQFRKSEQLRNFGEVEFLLCEFLFQELREKEGFGFGDSHIETYCTGDTMLPVTPHPAFDAGRPCRTSDDTDASKLALHRTRLAAIVTMALCEAVGRLRAVEQGDCMKRKRPQPGEALKRHSGQKGTF